MAHWLAIRAQMVLLSADGMSNVEVAEHLYVHPNTVGKWRERFRVRRLAGLLDEPRPGAPRTILDDTAEDMFEPLKDVATFRRFEVSEATLYRWRDEFLKGGEAALCGEKAEGQARRIEELERDVAERGRVIGELTITSRIPRTTAHDSY